MTVARNPRAGYQYIILREIEAGMSLTGVEVKSLRSHGADIKHSYAKIENGEVFLINAHIALYEKSSNVEYDPKRVRKLLLSRKEIRSIQKEIEVKGVTLVPLKIYFKNGWAKVSLAVARGKSRQDKREAIRKKDAAREISRELKKHAR
ncbi:MAG: SsrA-binding protein SmpB [Elusimicrobia bacterium]|nr:SsrA-binding protein SmpB [Elusimicrobiota bacterium]